MPHPEEIAAAANAASVLALLAAETPAAQLASLLQTGTWTPVDASGAGLVINAIAGRWYRLGNLVVAQANLQYPATASGLASKIGGLPFPADNNQAGRQGFLSYYNAGPTPLFAIPDGSASTYSYFGAGGGALTNAAMTTSYHFLTLIYGAQP